MFVITGATGNTGSVAAQRLLAAGKQVRVIVRNAAKASELKKLGAEVFLADLQDQPALEKAFAGAEGVYFISPPDLGAKDFIGERKQLTQQIVDTLVRARVKHVVLLSSVAAQAESGTGPIVSVHNAEQQLRASGLPSTFVRAAYFAENWAAVIPVAKQEGVLPAFFPIEQALSMVGTKDIGVAAAQALLDGPRGLRIIELAGPKDLSAADVAASLTGLLGREVKATRAPLEAVVPTFTRAGMSENMAELFRDLNAGVASGLVKWEGNHEFQRGSTEIAETLRALI